MRVSPKNMNKFRSYVGRFYECLGKVAYYCLLPILAVYGKTASRPRVRALIIHDNNVLLARNWFGHQKWTLLGGGVLKGESETRGLQREVEEELGVVLGAIELHHLDTFKLTEKWAPYKISVYIFRADIPGPIVLNKMEILDAQWFSLDELPPDVSSEFKEVLRRYKRIDTE